jgi:hypothetical protein
MWREPHHGLGGMGRGVPGARNREHEVICTQALGHNLERSRLAIVVKPSPQKLIWVVTEIHA